MRRRERADSLLKGRLTGSLVTVSERSSIVLLSLGEGNEVLDRFGDAEGRRKRRKGEKEGEE